MGQDRIDSNLRRIEDHETAPGREHGADSWAVFFEGTIERHPHLRAEFTGDLGKGAAMGGNPEDSFEFARGLTYEPACGLARDRERTGLIRQFLVNGFEVRRLKRDVAGFQLDAPEPPLEQAHRLEARLSSVQELEFAAEQAGEEAFFQEEDGDAGVALRRLLEEDRFPALAGPADRAGGGGHEYHENVGGEAHGSGGDEVLAWTDHCVIGEETRVESGFQKGGELLGEGRIFGSVRRENREQAELYKLDRLG